MKTTRPGNRDLEAIRHALRTELRIDSGELLALAKDIPEQSEEQWRIERLAGHS